MKYIISYDISNSQLRKELSDFLISNNFIRIQKSVFLGNIESDLLSKKTLILNSFLSDKTDSLLVCPLCSDDFMKSYFLGQTFDLDNFDRFKDFILF